MTTVTITLEAPKFSRSPGWTPSAVVKLIEASLADNCDLPGLAITGIEVDQ
ncbi:hypothetical protein [Aeromicrobium sp. UC242_57]|uniref:hypothetical protein n=1 Tax=Aeromicrobium sp. UC242_57 TaxID=3374624 RepID=UPI00379D075A